ncbi:Stk1 family PASTA domain-containing Ser/Thr kinase [Nocardioides gilvus]|uniref:Stk1 family PASTA domain-containing Ser/Thr kinase n=1 Tax=Nocardioides gilvus TaxID=1735589 RepID=UPI001EF6E691|nr:Stk1 family PASTA domain-containing Ser/Thr kinase [Nocardioides gilvus]
MEPDEHTRQRASVDPGDPLVGRLLDRRYLLLRRIARGGMAGVYEAVDQRLERTVAIKVMHPGMGDGNDFAARFVREARAAAKLSHPNVVAVHDQGEDDGIVFLAMEYVPGQTLRDVIKDRAPLSPAAALALLEPVLGALAAAHRAGVVHRDIKPENVLIGEGQAGDPALVKVADFGLAKAISATSQHTATGVVIGTVSYLAPELVVQGQADARVDVYAVGVVLHELLTGVKPHEGENQIQVAYKHVHEDVPAPSLLVPGIPGYVDALVARATARDRDQRPSDAGVLLHQVRRVAQALREGITEDHELESDLRPAPVVAPLAVELEAEREGISDVEEVFATAAAAPVTDRTQQLQALSPAELQAMGAGAPGAVATGGAHLANADAADKPIRRLPSPEADRRTTDRGRRGRRGPFVLILALLLVLAIGVGAWWFGFARYTTTPSLMGLSQSEAVAELEANGLQAQVGEPSYDEEIAKDLVVTSDPEPGDRVLDGDTVTLSLSLGPERYDVPQLTGKDDDAARVALEELKLEYGRKVEKWSETVPEGQVISTNPKAGTTVRPGTAVNVTLSKGREPVEVTDFTGKKADRAQARLEKAGLVVARDEVFDDEVAEGIVISQSPTEGTLFKEDTVTLKVSKGPTLVEMPRVVAQSVAAATKTLEDLGFEVEVQNSSAFIGLRVVLSTDPRAGSMVPKGSTVTLSLV